ncbi:MAG: PQQ-dependent dehydrogenase, methanol/ethanol family [Rhodospirillales bacterium 20-64-7]|nr:MAG: PQQ-dependent dehydrogenase, methanol/ethanol family [Rhodospirillales bacterium 20-64-7]HQT77219.1 PQQ-dependent dehydrogenase, methanol/ethanol family [Rhodopila sp.]
MGGNKRIFLATVAAALLGAGTVAATAGEVDNYSPVTQQRLENPEPGNWLLYRRTYDGHGFSPLKQINVDNVKSLEPVWTFSTGVGEGHEAPPMVNNGIMYVATPYGQVLALNAKTGDLIWRYKHKLPEDLFQLHPTSRGVAMWGDKLFLAATDDHLIAIDAKTGKEVWNTKVQDYQKGQYMTLEPLVVNGKVMVGGSGGEFGVRGYVAAFDADSGKELWRTYTIPAPGEPGSNTWQGDAWKTGGGSVWITGTYDPKRNIAYWGVGNAAPWPGDQHPGDNLFTSSVIALNPDTGKMVGYHQYHQNDSWDWDEIDSPMLIKMNHNGQPFDGLVHPGRDGYLWVLKQDDQGIHFVSGKPFVGQNAFKGLDESGRPIVDPEHKPTTGKNVSFCPSLWGGKDWPAAAYNPDTKLLYIPANNNMCESLEGKKQKLVVGQIWLGADADNAKLLPQKQHIGELQAWDPETGKQAWMHPFQGSQLFGSVLTTAGDLVFVGGTNDRMFRAFNGKTGELLWQQKTNSGIMGMPVAYEVDGTEYVAIQSGWGVDAQRIQDMLAKTDMKVNPDVPQGGVVWVFAVKH